PSDSFVVRRSEDHDVPAPWHQLRRREILPGRAVARLHLGGIRAKRGLRRGISGTGRAVAGLDGGWGPAQMAARRQGALLPLDGTAPDVRRDQELRGNGGVRRPDAPLRAPSPPHVLRRRQRRPAVPGHVLRRRAVAADHPRPELGRGFEAMTLAAGSRLGPYEVLSPVGAGGMGEVYKAKDTRLDRTV